MNQNVDEVLFCEAKKIILEEQRASVRLLMDRLSVSWATCERLMQALEEKQIVKRIGDNEAQIIVNDKPDGVRE